MKELIERVARELCAHRIKEVGIGDAMPDSRDVDCRWEIFAQEARAAIRTVLAYLSEPGNVTKEMAEGFGERYMQSGATIGQVVASAMRAALEEFK